MTRKKLEENIKQKGEITEDNKRGGEWNHTQMECDKCGCEKPAVWYIVGQFNHVRCKEHHWVTTVEYANLCFYRGDWITVWDMWTKGANELGILELRENGLKRHGIPVDDYLPNEP